MSPGRYADPDTWFSAAGTSAVTRTGRPSAAMPRIAAITAAPPAMSVRIRCMPSAGLIDRPPVSNVMPLPTSSRCFAAPDGLYVISISRGGRDEPPPTARTPPKPCVASHFSSRTATSTRGPATRAAVSASQAGLLTLDGVFARSRVSAVDAASTEARATSALYDETARSSATSRTVRTDGEGSSPDTLKR